MESSTGASQRMMLHREKPASPTSGCRANQKWFMLPGVALSFWTNVPSETVWRYVPLRKQWRAWVDCGARSAITVYFSLRR